MSAFYLDSSAIVKRYLTEIGSAWIRELCNPGAQNEIIVSEITLVEVAAALAARHRALGNTSQLAHSQTLALFRRHYVVEYSVIPFGRSILNLAVDLTQRQRLRGYDAVQLASAITANAVLATTDQPGLTFISADHDLVTAASNEALPSEDPNLHP